MLDGRSDEPAWEAIPPLPAVGHSPTFGAEPSERTEFRLAYDDVYLYASGRLFDTHPDGVRRTSLRRDESSPSNDWFSINLDTFLDRETTLTFGTTPTGLRSDLAWSNDGTTPNFTHPPAHRQRHAARQILQDAHAGPVNTGPGPNARRA